MNDLLFIISDVIETPEGVAICGTSPELDSLEDDEIASLLNGTILVDLPRGMAVQSVSIVKSSISLFGKRNVFLLLFGNEPDETWLGRSVYRK